MEIEITWMWHLKRTIISVLAMQERIKNTFTHIKKIPGNLSLSEIKKILSVSTALSIQYCLIISWEKPLFTLGFKWKTW